MAAAATRAATKAAAICGCLGFQIGRSSLEGPSGGRFAGWGHWRHFHGDTTDFGRLHRAPGTSGTPGTSGASWNWIAGAVRPATAATATASTSPGALADSMVLLGSSRHPAGSIRWAHDAAVVHAEVLGARLAYQERRPDRVQAFGRLCVVHWRVSVSVFHPIAANSDAYGTSTAFCGFFGCKDVLHELFGGSKHAQKSAWNATCSQSGHSALEFGQFLGFGRESSLVCGQ